MVNAPVVYGYVRVSQADSARARRLRQQIGEYCQREGLALELVFADSGIDDAELARPGWTALLDALGRTTSHIVVLPALDHLSQDPVLRAELRAQLAGSGATVVVIPKAASFGSVLP